MQSSSASLDDIHNHNNNLQTQSNNPYSLSTLTFSCQSFLLQLFSEFHIDSKYFIEKILVAMSTAFLAAIAVILCILFRLLNVHSQPMKPIIWCLDDTFLDCIYKIAPILREP